MPARQSDEFASGLFQLYDERRPLYELALGRINDSLKAIAADRKLFTVSQQRRIRVEHGRVKEAPRLLAKAQAPKYATRILTPADIFTEITDIAGTRVTCNTVSDVRAIVQGIKDSQTVNFPSSVPLEKALEDYITDPKHSGYRAVHLLVETSVPHGAQFVEVICEVQIRTLLQHAWGELTHEDTFKPEVKVPTLVASLSKRLATTLAVLDEIAQDLRDELEKIESDPAARGRDEVGEEVQDERPIPQSLLKHGLLAEVFDSVMGRPLAIPADLEDRYRRELSRSGFSKKDELEKALSAAREASIAIFSEFPFVYDDVDILNASLPYAKAGIEGVAESLRSIGQRKSSQVRQWANFEDDYAPGASYVGTVIRVTPRYALIQLSTGDTGILSARHLEQGKSIHANLEHYVAPGDALRVEVVNSDAKDQRIELRPVGLWEPRYRS